MNAEKQTYTQGRLLASIRQLKDSERGCIIVKYSQVQPRHLRGRIPSMNGAGANAHRTTLYKTHA